LFVLVFIFILLFLYLFIFELESGCVKGISRRNRKETENAYTAERVDELLDPGNYTGLAAEFVDRVLAQGSGGSD
jgi:hypothetical protein